MRQANAYTKIHNEVHDLKQEIQILRSLLIGILGRDEEGEYKPTFVRKILRSAGEKPTHVFRGPGSLLTDIQNAK